MEKLIDIIAYIVKNYPNKDELSNARVTKMVFLADWHQAIYYKKQISNIKWLFDNYGPFVQDIRDSVEKNSDIFSITKTSTMYGNKKMVFQMRKNDYEPDITGEEKGSLDHIIRNTQDLNWDEFIKLVYSTYPVMSSERYSYLDLIQKAEEYKKQN